MKLRVINLHRSEAGWEFVPCGVEEIGEPDASASPTQSDLPPPVELAAAHTDSAPSGPGASALLSCIYSPKLIFLYDCLIYYTFFMQLDPWRHLPLLCCPHLLLKMVKSPLRIRLLGPPPRLHRCIRPNLMQLQELLPCLIQTYSHHVLFHWQQKQQKQLLQRPRHLWLLGTLHWTLTSRWKPQPCLTASKDHASRQELVTWTMALITLHLHSYPQRQMPPLPGQLDCRCHTCCQCDMQQRSRPDSLRLDSLQFPRCSIL